MDQVHIHHELECLKAMERVRSQHEIALERERALADADRKRNEEWLKRAEESWAQEEQFLERRLDALEAASYRTCSSCHSQDHTTTEEDSSTPREAALIEEDSTSTGASAVGVGAYAGGAGVYAGGVGALVLLLVVCLQMVIKSPGDDGALAGEGVVVAGCEEPDRSNRSPTDDITDPVLRTVTKPD